MEWHLSRNTFSCFNDTTYPCSLPDCCAYSFTLPISKCLALVAMVTTLPWLHQQNNMVTYWQSRQNQDVASSNIADYSCNGLKDLLNIYGAKDMLLDQNSNLRVALPFTKSSAGKC